MLSNVGPYAIGELVTETDQVAFYLTENPISREKLMIKLLKYPESIWTQYECDALEILRHENIIQAVGIYKTEDYVGIVLPYYQHGDLYEYLINNTLSEFAAQRVIRQILKAVEYMHSNGYWHRDIKTENVFISDIDEYGPNVVLADLGFSRKFSRDEKSREFCGTWNYSAPEILSRVEYNSQVDMWAVGVLSFFILGNYLPFPKDLKDMIKCVLGGYFDFDDYAWDERSEKSKEFIISLLKVEAEDRLTASEALDDSWFLSRLDNEPYQVRNLVGVDDPTFDFAFDNSAIDDLEIYGLIY